MEAIMAHPLFIALAISLVINMLMFLVAFRFQSDKLTDISYAVTFVAIALWGLLTSERGGYHVVLTIMVVLWAFRLGGFLLYRVIRNGKDSRFDSMRGNFFRFGKFWLLQAVTVWVIMIPSVFAYHANGTYQALLVGGVLVWLTGLVCETVADFQKLAFSSQSGNKNKWIESGIWRYSRHPNYFGEILVWVGVYLYTIPVLSGLMPLVALVSPLFIIGLLLFVSGIPILEKSADKRWGNIPAYRAYKKRTSILIPLPPRA